MPKSTVQEENPYKLPEDVYLPVRLLGVTEKRIPFTYKKGDRAGEKGEIVKWEWEFEIISGEYSPLKVFGETEAKVTVTPDGQRNNAAMYIEALRDAPVDFGESIDTHDYSGLGAVVQVRHDARERGDGGGMFYSTPIKSIYPEKIMAELAAAGQVQAEEPPF